MKLQTEVKITRDGFSLEAGDGIVLLGSCFSDEIGAKLTADKFNCAANPFGVLYNPASILTALRILIRAAKEENFPNREFFDRYLFCSNGTWNSWLHSSKFSSADRTECEEKITRWLAHGSQTLKSAKALIITFGTNRAYCLANDKDPFVVANCHKVPSTTFRIRELEIGEITRGYTEIINDVTAINPDIQILFTVSPYRYSKYGFHGSNLGKAVLLLAEDAIIKAMPERCHYFPSYEILTDELRDYRFYAEDMLHPSPQAVEHIYDKFKEYAFEASAKEFTAKWNAVARNLHHRPILAQSQQYFKMMQDTKDSIISLAQTYKSVNLQETINMVDNILNKKP